MGFNIQSHSSSSEALPSVAYLGPTGTYSHQAALDCFGGQVKYIEKSSITDTFLALSADIPYCIIPKENSIFGSVIETYDLLRRKDACIDRYICGETTLQVQHCLLVKKGTRLEDIKRVLSHEQALGQCAQFCSDKLPEATTVKVNSTAAAAKFVAEDVSADSAAICSYVCASVYDGLEVIARGIQTEDNNFTKFWIMRYRSPSAPNGPISNLHGNALLRLNYKLPGPLDFCSLVSTLELQIRQIDRRPSINTPPFHDVYFLQVSKPPIEQHGELDEGCWISDLEAALGRASSAGWEGCVVGNW